MSCIYGDLLQESQRDMRMMNLQLDAFEEEIERKTMYVESCLKEAYLNAENYILECQGSTDDLMRLYQEADEQSAEPKKGILQSLIDWIGKTIESIGSWISEHLGGREKEIQQLKDVKVDKESHGIISALKSVWSTVTSNMAKLINRILGGEVINPENISLRAIGIPMATAALLSAKKKSIENKQSWITLDGNGVLDVKRTVENMCNRCKEWREIVKKHLEQARNDANKYGVSKQQQVNAQREANKAAKGANSGNTTDGGGDASGDGNTQLTQDSVEDAFDDGIVFYEKKRNRNRSNTQNNSGGNGGGDSTQANPTGTPAQNTDNQQNTQQSGTGTNTQNQGTDNNKPKENKTMKGQGTQADTDQYNNMNKDGQIDKTIKIQKNCIMVLNVIKDILNWLRTKGIGILDGAKSMLKLLKNDQSEQPQENQDGEVQGESASGEGLFASGEDTLFAEMQASMEDIDYGPMEDMLAWMNESTEDFFQSMEAASNSFDEDVYKLHTLVDHIHQDYLIECKEQALEELQASPDEWDALYEGLPGSLKAAESSIAMASKERHEKKITKSIQSMNQKTSKYMTSVLNTIKKYKGKAAANDKVIKKAYTFAKKSGAATVPYMSYADEAVAIANAKAELDKIIAKGKSAKNFTIEANMRIKEINNEINKKRSKKKPASTDISMSKALSLFEADLKQIEQIANYAYKPDDVAVLKSMSTESARIYFNAIGARDRLCKEITAVLTRELNSIKAGLIVALRKKPEVAKEAVEEAVEGYMENSYYDWGDTEDFLMEAPDPTVDDITLDNVEAMVSDEVPQDSEIIENMEESTMDDYMFDDLSMDDLFDESVDREDDDLDVDDMLAEAAVEAGLIDADDVYGESAYDDGFDDDDVYAESEDDFDSDFDADFDESFEESEDVAEQFVNAVLG